MEITTFWDPWCVIFTYTPPFIFRIPPQLIVELEVSSVTRLSSVLIICWSQGGLVGDDMCSVGYHFVLSKRNRQMTSGVSIIFKNQVFYKAWFERFEFFIVWPNAVFHKMQVVFYKSAHFMYLWSTNSVFAKCDLQSSKVLKQIHWFDV